MHDWIRTWWFSKWLHLLENIHPSHTNPSQFLPFKALNYPPLKILKHRKSWARIYAVDADFGWKLNFWKCSWLGWNRCLVLQTHRWSKRKKNMGRNAKNIFPSPATFAWMLKQGQTNLNLRRTLGRRKYGKVRHGDGYLIKYAAFRINSLLLIVSSFTHARPEKRYDDLQRDKNLSGLRQAGNVKRICVCKQL